MGYYKQQQIADQEAIDDIIRWWKSHEGQPMPEYLLKAIVEDERFFDKVQFLWEGHVDAVLRQKRMTRKESERLLREMKRRSMWDMRWQDVRFLFYSLVTSLIVTIGMVFYALAVTV